VSREYFEGQAKLRSIPMPDLKSVREARRLKWAKRVGVVSVDLALFWILLGLSGSWLAALGMVAIADGLWWSYKVLVLDD
jgi:hypothetical protein